MISVFSRKLSSRLQSSSTALQFRKRHNKLSTVLFISALSMSTARFNPPSLTGEPTLSLVAPGACQLTTEFTSLPLLERIKISETSSVLRFELPDKSKPLNLSTCACILAKATIDDKEDGEEVIRPYTPISTNKLKGCFDLLVKDYPNGKMSRHLHLIQNGDMIDFKHIDFNVKIQAPFKQKNIVMLVGGTGITPMIQALHAILGDNEAKNKVIMLYGSRVSTDILGKELIDRWAENYSNRFTNIHVLSDEEEGSPWAGERGYISKDLLKKHIPDPSVGDDLLIFVCGPPTMYNALCGPRDEKKLKGLLKGMGYNESQVYKF